MNATRISIFVLGLFFVVNGCSSDLESFRSVVAKCDSNLVGDFLEESRETERSLGVDEIMEILHSDCDPTVKVEMLDHFENLSVLLKKSDELGSTPMHAAVSNGLEVFDYLIKRGGDLNSTNAKSGETLLLLAARQNDVQMFKRLLELGARTDVADNSGAYPIHAVSYGSVELFRSLVKKSPEEAKRPDSYRVVPAFHVLMSRTRKSEKLAKLHLLVKCGVDLSVPISLPRPLPDSQIEGGIERPLPLDGETAVEFGARTFGIEASEFESMIGTDAIAKP